MNMPENPGLPNILDRLETPVIRKSSAAALLESALADSFSRLSKRFRAFGHPDDATGAVSGPGTYVFT
jgi:hypothetical protein